MRINPKELETDAETAADKIAAWEHRAALVASTYRITIGVIVGVLLVGAIYISGRESGGTDREVAQLVQHRVTTVDTIRATEIRYVHDSARTAHTEQAQAVAAAQADAADTHVEVTSSGSVAIDRAASVTVDPTLVNDLQLCRSARVADANDLTSLRAEVKDLKDDRNAWALYAVQGDSIITASKPPRFGFRAGVVVGAIATIILHLALR